MSEEATIHPKPMAWDRALRHIRDERGLSLQDLADDLKVSKYSLYQIETGLAEPGQEILGKLSVLIDIQTLRKFAENPERIPASKSWQAGVAITRLREAEGLSRMELARAIEVKHISTKAISNCERGMSNRDAWGHLLKYYNCTSLDDIIRKASDLPLKPAPIDTNRDIKALLPGKADSAYSRNSIGRALRVMRIEKGLNLTEVSSITGVGIGILSKIENGKIGLNPAIIGGLRSLFNMQRWIELAKSADTLEVGVDSEFARSMLIQVMNTLGESARSFSKRTDVSAIYITKLRAGRKFTLKVINRIGLGCPEFAEGMGITDRITELNKARELIGNPGEPQREKKFAAAVLPRPSAAALPLSFVDAVPPRAERPLIQQAHTGRSEWFGEKLVGRALYILRLAYNLQPEFVADAVGIDRDTIMRVEHHNEISRLNPEESARWMKLFNCDTQSELLNKAAGARINIMLERIKRDRNKRPRPDGMPFERG